MSILDLPTTILDNLTSTLDIRTAKSLSQVHSHLTESSECRIWNTLRLPLSSTTCVPYSFLSNEINDRNGIDVYRERADEISELELSMRYITSLLTVKSTPFQHLDDLHCTSDTQSTNINIQSTFPTQTNPFESKSTTSNTTPPTHQTWYPNPPSPTSNLNKPILSRRISHIRTLQMDLTTKYHSLEKDLDSIEWTEIFGHPFHYSWALDDPTSFHFSRLYLSNLRQLENPIFISSLKLTFDSFPILLGVKKLIVTIYESWIYFLPFLFPLVPSVEEIHFISHELLMESSLSFCTPDYSTWTKFPYLKKVDFEGFIPCLESLENHLIIGSRFNVKVTRIDPRGGKITSVRNGCTRVDEGFRVEKKNGEKIVNELADTSPVERRESQPTGAMSWV